MDFKSVMAALKKSGTAQNIKIYRRHGAKGDMFGVSFAVLGQLKKKIETNHDLALALWQTGNIDAMSLATMIADAKRLSSSDADRWVKDINYYVLADLFAAMVSRADCTPAKIKKWTSSKSEYIRQTGYSLLASGLKNNVDISDEECLRLIAEIEKNIHSSPNRARQAMNNALIAIGVFRPSLSDKAVESARRIGKVEVDHGDTSCKTPDAESYIKKSLRRRK